jgi:ATP-dependent helicase/nuclease subunit B
MGTIIHEALEKCISAGLDCDDDELRRRVQAFGEEQLKVFYGDETPPDSMMGYFSALLKKIERLLILFKKEFAQSEFVPVAFEQKIGSGDGAVSPVVIPLTYGTLSMIGIVDRVDVFEKDGKKYLRVIDYKSGKKAFSLSKIEHGIDVQMLMYLCALKQNLFPGETCVPAGVQYVGANPAIVPALRGEPADRTVIQWEEKIPRSGLYLKDAGVLHAMDASEERKFLKIKKADSPFFVTEERFGELFESIEGLLKKMGDALHTGQVDKNPIRIGNLYNSCEHCDLKNYCRHPDPQDVLRARAETQGNGTEEGEG